MLSVERIAQKRQKIAYSTLISFPSSKNIVMDSRTFTYSASATSQPDIFIASKESYEDEKYQNYVKTQGGIFADEMGLGKTISMISLILSNPRIKKSSGDYGETVSELREKEDAELEDEEMKEEDLKKPPSEKKLQARKERKEEYEKQNKIYFQSPATLVVCPSQLVNQWAQEITKNTNLKVKTAATAAQHKKLSYKSLIENDVIIISSRYLIANVSYRELISRRENVDKGKSLHFVGGDLTPEISYSQPIFHLVGWHRIIIDEAHEIVPDFEYHKYKSNFRWYVSGTPLPNKHRSLNDALQFINFSHAYMNLNQLKIDRNMNSHCLSSELYNRIVKRTVFWRNTKSSVENQVEIPPVSEEIEIVRLSPIERTIYNSLCFDGKNARNENEKRLFLSNPSKLVSRMGSSLDDVTLPIKFLCKIKRSKNLLVQHLKGNKTYLTQTIKELKDNEALMAREGKTKARKEQIAVIKRRIKRGEEDIQRNEADIIAEICKSACFSRLLVGESTDEICDSCNEYVCGRCEIKSCEHFLCADCIANTFQSAKTKKDFVCPKCKCEIDITKISLSKDDKLPPPDLSILHNDESEELWYNSLRITYGSKFASTAKYLYHIMISADDVKMIVFSQYEASLTQIALVLENIDPDVFENKMVMCKGNVHARKNKLDRFTSTGPDSARILLLSLKNSASGTHLAAATHVLLLDPVIGTEGEARATDAQAIARAHRIGQGDLVTAIRFIVVDTIDQQDYENAYGAIVVPTGYGPKSARK